MADDRFCGLASRRIRRLNGSQISSPQPAAGNSRPAISSVTGMVPMARSSFEDCDPWAFAIDRHRRALPWQNAYAERLIGSIRRECLDHIVVLGEGHLRHVLASYMQYHNDVRTHLSLEKDAPFSRAVDSVGRIICRPILGGLHHQYIRI